MKKKTVSILLMAAMAPSLAACGFSNSTDSSSKSSSKAERHDLHPALLRKQRAHPVPRAQQTAKYLTIPLSPYLPQRA